MDVLAIVTPIDTDEYEDMPLEGHIVSGDPKARVHWIRREPSGDGILQTGLFMAQPSVCRWVFEGDETIYVIEGEVRIDFVESGETVELTAGDIGSFPKGVDAIWTFKKPFKEFFVLCG